MGCWNSGKGLDRGKKREWLLEAGKDGPSAQRGRGEQEALRGKTTRPKGKLLSPPVPGPPGPGRIGGGLSPDAEGLCLGGRMGRHGFWSQPCISYRGVMQVPSPLWASVSLFAKGPWVGPLGLEGPPLPTSISGRLSISGAQVPLACASQSLDQDSGGDEPESPVQGSAWAGSRRAPRPGPRMSRGRSGRVAGGRTGTGADPEVSLFTPSLSGGRAHRAVPSASATHPWRDAMDFAGMRQAILSEACAAAAEVTPARVWWEESTAQKCPRETPQPGHTPRFRDSQAPSWGGGPQRSSTGSGSLAQRAEWLTRHGQHLAQAGPEPGPSPSVAASGTSPRLALGSR